MPRYKLLAPHVVGDILLEAGAEVDIDYEPSLEMEALDKEAEKRLAAYKKFREEIRPDFPNFGWSLTDRLWYGYLVREGIEDALEHVRTRGQERRAR